MRRSSIEMQVTDADWPTLQQMVRDRKIRGKDTRAWLVAHGYKISKSSFYRFWARILAEETHKTAAAEETTAALIRELRTEMRKGFLDVQAALSRGKPAVGAPEPVTHREVLRRCRFLAHDSIMVAMDRKTMNSSNELPCPLCGKSKSAASLHSHIRREHAAVVATMPANQFQ